MPKTITTLYREFEAALDALRVYPRARSVADEKKYQAEYEADLDCCNTLCWKVVTAPAANIDEMLLKIAAAGWGSGARTPLDRWTNGDDSSELSACLVSLRADLRRMQQAASPRRAKRTGSRTPVGDAAARRLGR